MATKDQTPVHELRPETQELRIPERFIPVPTIEPGHSFSTITDHISTIVLKNWNPDIPSPTDRGAGGGGHHG